MIAIHCTRFTWTNLFVRIKYTLNNLGAHIVIERVREKKRVLLGEKKKKLWGKL